MDVSDGTEDKGQDENYGSVWFESQEPVVKKRRRRSSMFLPPPPEFLLPTVQESPARALKEKDADECIQTYVIDKSIPLQTDEVVRGSEANTAKIVALADAVEDATAENIVQSKRLLPFSPMKNTKECLPDTNISSTYSPAKQAHDLDVLRHINDGTGSSPDIRLSSDTRPADDFNSADVHLGRDSSAADDFNSAFVSEVKTPSAKHMNDDSFADNECVTPLTENNVSCDNASPSSMSPEFPVSPMLDDEHNKSVVTSDIKENIACAAETSDLSLSDKENSFTSNNVKDNEKDKNVSPGFMSMCKAFAEKVVDFVKTSPSYLSGSFTTYNTHTPVDNAASPVLTLSDKKSVAMHNLSSDSSFLADFSNAVIPETQCLVYNALDDNEQSNTCKSYESSQNNSNSNPPAATDTCKSMETAIHGSAKKIADRKAFYETFNAVSQELNKGRRKSLKSISNAADRESDKEEARVVNTEKAEKFTNPNTPTKDNTESDFTSKQTKDISNHFNTASNQNLKEVSTLVCFEAKNSDEGLVLKEAVTSLTGNGTAVIYGNVESSDGKQIQDLSKSTTESCTLNYSETECSQADKMSSADDENLTKFFKDVQRRHKRRALIVDQKEDDSHKDLGSDKNDNAHLFTIAENASSEDLTDINTKSEPLKKIARKKIAKSSEVLSETKEEVKSSGNKISRSRRRSFGIGETLRNKGSDTGEEHTKDKDKVIEKTASKPQYILASIDETAENSALNKPDETDYLLEMQNKAAANNTILEQKIAEMNITTKQNISSSELETKISNANQKKRRRSGTLKRVTNKVNIKNTSGITKADKLSELNDRNREINEDMEKVTTSQHTSTSYDDVDSAEGVEEPASRSCVDLNQLTEDISQVKIIEESGVAPVENPPDVNSLEGLDTESVPGPKATQSKRKRRRSADAATLRIQMMQETLDISDKPEESSPNSGPITSQKICKKRKLAEETVEQIEKIYKNKNFVKPEEKKPWHTIIESPNTDELFGKKKFQRCIDFEKPTQMKLRRRLQRAVKNGWDPKKKKRTALKDEFVKSRLDSLWEELDDERKDNSDSLQNQLRKIVETQ